MLGMRLVGASAACMLIVGTSPVMAGDASTIRVEPRPFYGATITLEAGVRVFRPLPKRKYVVINPGNKTPLGLNLTEVNETRRVYNENHNYNHGQTQNSAAPNGYVSGARRGYRGRPGRFRRGGGGGKPAFKGGPAR